jgi:6-phosphogluconolactonase
MPDPSASEPTTVAASPELVVLPDSNALANAAADRFLQIAQEAIDRGGRFAVALSGGSTPEKMHALLTAPERSAKIPWDRVFAFQGDERFVPHTDPGSNYGMAIRTLLDPAGVPEGNRFPMPVPPNVTDLGDAARRYTSTLEIFFQASMPAAPPMFDLILLGLGDDGHTASLFPGMPSLDVEAAWVVGTPPGVLPPPVNRLTLTLPVLNAARHVVFLVGGANKADALQAILDRHASVRERPAAGVRPIGGTLTFLVDQAAASRLSRDNGDSGAPPPPANAATPPGSG